MSANIEFIRPGHLHVLVGRNGAGKSAHLARAATALEVGVLDQATSILALTGEQPAVVAEGLGDRLHPLAQYTLVVSLYEAIERSGTTVVCTTYSPYLVDAVRAEDVFVVNDGRLRALAEHPVWPKWQRSMMPGEFWSSVGEDWV
jgi:ABC-type ATPase involved in cell division